MLTFAFETDVSRPKFIVQLGSPQDVLQLQALIEVPLSYQGVDGKEQAPSATDAWACAGDEPLPNVPGGWAGIHSPGPRFSLRISHAAPAPADYIVTRRCL
jgi:hypothetical protein